VLPAIWLRREEFVFAGKENLQYAGGMTLTLTIDDAHAALLTQEAARRHVPVEKMLASLITSHCEATPQSRRTPYKVKTFHSEFQLGVDFAKLNRG
jgi:hypothetical protein